MAATTDIGIFRGGSISKNITWANIYYMPSFMLVRKNPQLFHISAGLYKLVSE